MIRRFSFANRCRIKNSLSRRGFTSPCGGFFDAGHVGARRLLHPVRPISLFEFLGHGRAESLRTMISAHAFFCVLDATRSRGFNVLENRAGSLRLRTFSFAFDLLPAHFHLAVITLIVTREDKRCREKKRLRDTRAFRSRAPQNVKARLMITEGKLNGRSSCRVVPA